MGEMCHFLQVRHFSYFSLRLWAVFCIAAVLLSCAACIWCHGHVQVVELAVNEQHP